MINNLITHLKEEALEDAERKDLCDTELTTNTQTRKEKTATVEKFHDTVDKWRNCKCLIKSKFTKDPDSWSDSPVTQIWEQLFLEYQDSWLCVFFFASARSWSRAQCRGTFPWRSRTHFCTIQNSSSRPLKLRATAGTSGKCGRRSMI